MCALILYVLFILQLCLKRNLCFSSSEGDRSVSILVRVLGTPLREEEACPRDKSGVQEEDRMEHWGSVLAPCPGREPLLLLLGLLLSVGPCLDRDGMQIHRGWAEARGIRSSWLYVRGTNYNLMKSLTYILHSFSYLSSSNGSYTDNVEVVMLQKYFWQWKWSSPFTLIFNKEKKIPIQCFSERIAFINRFYPKCFTISPHIHQFDDKASASLSVALGVRCLAQGHLDT